MDDAERVRLVMSPKRDDVGQHVILLILTDLRPPPYAKSSRYRLKVNVIQPEVIPIHKEVMNATLDVDPIVELLAMQGRGLVRLVEVSLRVQQVTQGGKAIVNIYPP